MIGNRRLTAAKSGIENNALFRCGNDGKEQISTMLLENMQRSDLSVSEQARDSSSCWIWEKQKQQSRKRPDLAEVQYDIG